MFEVKELCFSYDKKHNIFSGVSFTLDEGDILSVVGINGAGKTTLLRCLTQTYKDYRGSIYYNNINLKNVSISDLSRSIGLVTTGDIIKSDISVLDYLCMGMVNQIAFFASPSEEHFRRSFAMCQKYNIDYLANQTLATLSQGELQMVTILRILIQDPQIIIMDEPSGALDLFNQRKLLEMIKQLSHEGKIVIQVTHNLDHIFDLGGKILVIDKDGTEFGEVLNLLTAERLTKMYSTEIRLAQFEECVKVIY